MSRDLVFRREEFLAELDTLDPEAQETVLLKMAEWARTIRNPCPCESGKSFGDCHGQPEPQTSWEQLESFSEALHDT
jgi:hypothetical protein